MHSRPFRIYLRPKWTSIPVFSFGFMTIMSAAAIATTHDSSRIVLISWVVTFCLLTYLSWRAGLAWIRIVGNAEEIVTVPCWYARRFFGEKGRSVKVAPESELVIARRTAYGALEGHCITLRAKNGVEEVLWSSINGIGRRRRARIASELEQKFGLHVLQVKQDITPGAHSETEWKTTFDRRSWRNMGAMLATSLIPFLGIPVRLLTADTKTIGLLGIVLWFCGVVGYWLLFRMNRPSLSKDSNLGIAVLVWTMTYIPFYLIAVVGTHALILKR